MPIQMDDELGDLLEEYDDEENIEDSSTTTIASDNDAAVNVNEKPLLASVSYV